MNIESIRLYASVEDKRAVEAAYAKLEHYNLLAAFGVVPPHVVSDEVISVSPAEVATDTEPALLNEVEPSSVAVTVVGGEQEVPQSDNLTLAVEGDIQSHELSTDAQQLIKAMDAGQKPSFNTFPEAFKETILRVVHFKNMADYDSDDTQQVGIIALWEAHQKYDHTKGTSFKTYANNYIKARLVDWARGQSHVGRRDYGTLKEYHRLSDEGLSDAEIASHLLLTVESLAQIRHRYHRLGRVVSLDAGLSDEEDSTPYAANIGVHEIGYEVIENEITKGDTNVRQLLLDTIQLVGDTARIAKLPRGVYASERDRDIFIKHYLDNTKMAPLAKEYNIGESRLSQICTNIEKQLHAYITTASIDERERWLAFLDP